MCSTKTNQPRLQGFSVNCPVFWQLCCSTGHFHDDDIWLQLPVFISFLFSYLNLASRWGLTTALICTRKEHRRTHCSSCSKLTSSCNLSYCRHFSHVANFFQIWSTMAGWYLNEHIIVAVIRSGNCNLSSCKLTWKKFRDFKRDSNSWPVR